MEQFTPPELVIIGGAGHVGLPLAVAFANQGVQTAILDVDEEALSTIRSGCFPFTEENGDEELQKAFRRGTLHIAKGPEIIAQAPFVLTVIGTPVDEHLSPDMKGIQRTIHQMLPYFRDGQTLILRSTVYPGTSEHIQQFFREQQRDVRVAFCPERLVEGKGLSELRTLPQIVAAFDDQTFQAVAGLFRKLTPRAIIRLTPTEAELGKLLCNAWRYIKFSVGNQFYMLAERKGLDYHRIFDAINEDYPRNHDLSAPGFAAGPCLLKDTMQLASFTDNTFFLGHAAMMVNEGMPAFLLSELKKKGPLRNKTIGILGMAFKPEVDDPRQSLSYKLRKLATLEAQRVLCHDPYIQDPSFTPLEQVLAESDILILATPHAAYRDITQDAFPEKTVINLRRMHRGAPGARPKRILITGGAGFVGFHLAKRLLAHTSDQIVLTDNLQRGRMDEELSALITAHADRISFMHADLTDPAAFAQFGSGFDHIYHLAAVNGTKWFYKMPAEVLRINTLTLTNLLEWVRAMPRKPKVCFTSSNEAYAGALAAFDQLPLPTPEAVPLVIEDPYNTRWTYAGTKLVGEQFMIHYGTTYDIPGVIVRPHNFYGPRAGYDHVIPEWCGRIQNRVDPFPLMSPDETRTFCYIDDAVEAMHLLMESPNTETQPMQTVHIGNTDEVAIGTLAETLFRVAGWRPTSLDTKPSPAGSVKRRVADISKIKQLVGWTPTTTLEEGLRQTFAWYTAHPKPPEPPTPSTPSV